MQQLVQQYRMFVTYATLCAICMYLFMLMRMDSVHFSFIIRSWLRFNTTCFSGLFVCQGSLGTSNDINFTAISLLTVNQLIENLTGCRSSSETMSAIFFPDRSVGALQTSLIIRGRRYKLQPLNFFTSRQKLLMIRNGAVCYGLLLYLLVHICLVALGLSLCHEWHNTF